MTDRRVVVVGAGIGGLVAALELADAGVEVLVLERAAHPGGKLRQLTVGGAAMDAGPTVFTMRWVFDALFDAIGEQLAAHLPLEPVEVLARHAWPGGARLDLFADTAQSADAIGHFAGADAARGYLAFCARARGIYAALERPFLQGSRPTPLSLALRAGWRGLPGLLRISPFAGLWQELGHHFADPRLRQLFGRYATYCGASPFLAPATLMLVAHVEQAGVWLLPGGMHRLAQVLAGLAAARGASFRYGAHVDEVLVRQGRAAGVRLAGGDVLDAQAVVFNGDVAALAGGLLGGAVRRAVPATAPAARSLSAVTFNLLAPTSGLPLLRHTVCFSDDYPREFDAIGQGRLPDAPTVYVCAQDRGGRDADPGPAGVPSPAERLLLIVNAPASGDSRPFTDMELARCEARSFDTMARCGLQLQASPQASQTTAPQDFERLFPATGGALYGRASHGWMASFQRPGARSRLPGLYLAGGSTHPGPGVPMAALSGRQAAASVLTDLPTRRPRPAASPRPAPASTAPSQPAVTPGGTSTR